MYFYICRKSLSDDHVHGSRASLVTERCAEVAVCQDVHNSVKRLRGQELVDGRLKIKKHFQPTQQPDFENLGPHQNSGLAVITGHYGVIWSRTDRGAHPFCLT